MPSQPVSEEEFDLGAVSDHSSDADLETQLAEQEREAGIRAVPPFDPETTAFPVLKAVRFLFDYICFFYDLFPDLKAYIQVTQNYTKLRSLLRKSELRNATLQAQAMGQRSSRKNLHPTVAKYSEEINNLGRKFSVLHQPWLGFKIERFRTRPDADPYSDTRYTTSAKNEQAMRAELFDFIPGHLHTSTGFSGFEQTVSFFCIPTNTTKTISIVYIVNAAAARDDGIHRAKTGVGNLPSDSDHARYTPATKLPS